MTFGGYLIEESLLDWSIINDLMISGVEICQSPNEGEGVWHIYTVINIGMPHIEKISKLIKPKGFYAHFGNDDQGIVVYPNKVFSVDPHNSETWRDAINFGMHLGIPPSQLDFSFEEL